MKKLSIALCKQAVTVLGKDRLIPHVAFRRPARGPTKQQVGAHLLHQHALAAHGVKHLQQEYTQRLSGTITAGPLSA